MDYIPKVIRIETGSNHTIFLTETHQAFSFGWAKYGQPGHGDTQERHTPTLIEILSKIDIDKVSAGAFFSIFSTKSTKDKIGFVTNEKTFFDCTIKFKN